MAFETIEQDGLYLGEVMEDVFETMARTHKRYAKIFCPSLWADADGDYPYTYLEGFDEIPHLHKGDKVYLKFNHDNFLYPTIGKYDMELHEKIYTLETVDGKKDSQIVSSRMLNNDSYEQVTENRYMIVYASSLFIIDKDEIKIYGKGSSITVGDKIDIKNNNTSLKDVVDSLTELIESFLVGLKLASASLTTATIATGGAVTAFEGLSNNFADDLLKIKTKTNSLLK